MIPEAPVAAGVPMLQNLCIDFRQKCHDLSLKLLPYAEMIAPPSTKTTTQEGKGDQKMAGELLASLMMGEGRVPSQAIIDAYGNDTEKCPKVVDE